MNTRIDAHHHLWDLAVRDQPWLSGTAMAPIRRSFGIEDIRAAAKTAGITATIAVQTVADIRETEELLDLADREPLVTGVVGYVDIAAADVDEQLDRLQDRRSGSWLVGIRSLVQDEPDPTWLQRPEVIAGLRSVARHGLTYDLLIRTHQLPATIDAVRTVDEGRFVLDHLAKPAIAAADWEPWASDLSVLARSGNVVAKLSGLVTETNWATSADWTVADLRPYVDHALSVFGANRLLFGSDWPVCTLATPYQRVVHIVDSVTDGLTPEERAAIFGGTAIMAYGLPLMQT